MAIDRTWYNTLVDDDGSNTVGSVWAKASVDTLINISDAEFAKHTGVGGSAYTASPQSIASGAIVQLAAAAWGGWHWQTAGFWNSGGFWQIPSGYGGIYFVRVACVWPPNVTGLRACYIYKNGVLWSKEFAPAYDIGGNGPTTATTVLAPCNAGDTFTFHLYQSSGVPQTLDPPVHFQLVRV